MSALGGKIRHLSDGGWCRPASVVAGQRAIVLFIILCLTLSISCGGRSCTSRLKAELETLSSWAATAQMVGEEWGRGAVPAAYARRTLRSALETFEREKEAINKLSATWQEPRADSLGRLEELKQSMLGLQEGIEQANRSQVEEGVGRIKTARQSLEATIQKLGEVEK